VKDQHLDPAFAPAKASIAEGIHHLGNGGWSERMKVSGDNVANTQLHIAINGFAEDSESRQNKTANAKTR
jgi:hypothetical protein